MNVFMVNKFNLNWMKQRKLSWHFILTLFFVFFYQGEQLCGILQLQIFSSLLGLLTTVLPFHCCNRFAVLYKVLDSKYSDLRTVFKCVKLLLCKKSKILRGPTKKQKIDIFTRTCSDRQGEMALSWKRADID